MIPTEDIIPIVKNTIAASIKYNTHRGYIGWTNWRYELLKSGICLCDEKSAKKPQIIMRPVRRR